VGAAAVRDPGLKAMRRNSRPVCTIRLALARAVHPATAADPVDAWRAAARNDREYVVGRADQTTAQPLRDQAAALWMPNVGLSAAAGVTTRSSQTRGAEFSAPGFGQSTGVDFSTSVANASSGRWAIVATQPLYNPARRTRQQPLGLSAALADMTGRTAGPTPMLRMASLALHRRCAACVPRHWLDRGSPFGPSPPLNTPHGISEPGQ